MRRLAFTPLLSLPPRLAFTPLLGLPPSLAFTPLLGLPPRLAFAPLLGLPPSLAFTPLLGLLRRLAFALLLGLLPSLAAAEPLAMLVRQVPALLCRQAIAEAAQAHGIPAGLMAAVAQVESGRRDPVTGAMNPWPWTVDADGQGSFFETRQQAIAAVHSLQARGVRSIDVGCMQINLMHHPHAFSSLDRAFDPTANADYAARFLLRLHAQTSSWPQATALYHSATPALAAAYEQKVMQAWPLQERLAVAGIPTVIARAPNPILGPVLLPPPRRVDTPHIIPRMPMAGGSGPSGRSLAAYRAAPIMAGWRRNGG